MKSNMLNQKSKEKSIYSKIKSLMSSKTFILFCVFFVVSITPIFAEGGESISALDDWGDKILGLFASNWVKVLLLVALVIEAIGMVVAGQQGGGGQIMKRFAPWIVGTLIILCASGIVSYFVGDLDFSVGMIVPTVENIATV